MTREKQCPAFGSQEAQAVVGEIIASDNWTSLAAGLRLSVRETQILACILTGAESDLAIADRIGSSSRTVHTHVERLYRKLGIRTRTQLITFVWAYIWANDGSRSTPRRRGS